MTKNQYNPVPLLVPTGQSETSSRIGEKTVVDTKDVSDCTFVMYLKRETATSHRVFHTLLTKLLRLGEPYTSEPPTRLN